MNKTLKILLLAAFAVVLFSCSEAEIAKIDEINDVEIGWLSKCSEEPLPSYCDVYVPPPSSSDGGGGTSSPGPGTSSVGGGTSSGGTGPGTSSSSRVVVVSSSSQGGGTCTPGNTSINLGYGSGNGQTLTAGTAYNITPERGSSFECTGSANKSAQINCKNVTFNQHNNNIMLSDVGNNLSSVVLNETMTCFMNW